MFIIEQTKTGILFLSLIAALLFIALIFIINKKRKEKNKTIKYAESVLMKHGIVYGVYEPLFGVNNDEICNSIKAINEHHCHNGLTTVFLDQKKSIIGFSLKVNYGKRDPRYPKLNDAEATLERNNFSYNVYNPAFYIDNKELADAIITIQEHHSKSNPLIIFTDEKDRVVGSVFC